MKVKTSKGFTLAELLIVMAIIVVLAAVAIPTFGRQLETARETNDMEVIRNIYTDVYSLAVQDGTDGKLDGKVNGVDLTATGIAFDEATASSDADHKYTVTVATWLPGAKFAQVGTAAVGAATATGTWKYVGNKLANKTVPPVNNLVATLEFVFDISVDGEVTPHSAAISAASITDGLFTPAAATATP